jgi:hypothetical protein
MDINKFIKENLNWIESEKGTLDFNGIKSVLNDYSKELLNENSKKIQFKVHGNNLEENKFEDLIRPIMKFLCENYHPHVKIIITPTNAVLLEELKSTGYIDEYVL